MRDHHILPTVTLLLLLIFSASCSATRNQAVPPKTTQPSAGSIPSGATYNAQSEDGQWVMAAKDHASTRYSGLTEINTQNAKDLRIAWTFSTGVNRGQEASPIVVNNTMYVVTPYPNILFALDLTKGGSLKWKYEPQPASASQGVACCDVVNRGAVYADQKIFLQHSRQLHSGR